MKINKKCVYLNLILVKVRALECSIFLQVLICFYFDSLNIFQFNYIFNIKNMFNLNSFVIFFYLIIIYLDT